VVSEALELFGGAGYMEDSGLPRALRDVQVNTIWEGTTNVLSLDVLRALHRTPAVMTHYLQAIQSRLVKFPKSLGDSVEVIKKGIDEITSFLSASQTPDALQSTAREFAFSLARVYMASLLVEHANWSNKEADIAIAQRWCTRQPLSTICYSSPYVQRLDKIIALDMDNNLRPRGCGDVDEDKQPRARM
jgi:hypothetical protein